METFIEAKSLIENPDFNERRRMALGELSFDAIDKPIVEVIKKITSISYCFTLQSCYGHFLYAGQKDPHNIEPVSLNARDQEVEYRIAYLAICVQNNPRGRKLLEDISKIPSIDQKNIQYGSAEWFWERQINSFVVQVEPERFKSQDRCVVNYTEAITLERVRSLFWQEINEIVDKHIEGF
jgi:hypothetical protein